MAVSKKTGNEIVSPSVGPEVGIELLKRLVADGDRILSNRPIGTVDKKIWENKAEDFFLRVFGSGSKNIDVVLNAGSRSSSRINQGEEYYENIRFECLRDQVRAANSMIELLELDIDLSTACPSCGRLYPKGLHNFCLQCGTALSELNEGKTLVSPAAGSPTAVQSITAKMIREDGSYWETSDTGERIGEPYCSRCWEVEGIRVHLTKWKGMQFCPQCASSS